MPTLSHPQPCRHEVRVGDVMRVAGRRQGRGQGEVRGHWQSCLCHFKVCVCMVGEAEQVREGPWPASGA